jgi:hypothetical protein
MTSQNAEFVMSNGAWAFMMLALLLVSASHKDNLFLGFLITILLLILRTSSSIFKRSRHVPPATLNGQEL